MRDVRKFISPYHYERSRATELVKKYAEGVGLNVEHCENREKIFIYESDELVRSEFFFEKFDLFLNVGVLEIF